MSKPTFTHDCTSCRFLGHYFDHDVYTCGKSGMGLSIIARFGDDGPDYASSPLNAFINSLKADTLINVLGETMKFREYLFSSRCVPYHKAWATAMMIHYGLEDES